ncbi:MAG TPA: HlyC/CorC family transporter [Clostridiales bacterium]|nr:HlyC/CorC family transporter [Clostridiales bacterium]
MDGDGWPRVILLIILLLGASYCASAEIAFASLNTVRVKSLADKGDKRAINALHVIDNFDKALTTLLIGNNITHIGFASLATLIVTQLWGTLAVKYSTVVSTIIVFLFSEMLPKSYAKSNLNYALAVSSSLNKMIRIFTPLTKFFTFISDSFIRLFGVTEEAEMNEEDFYEIMESVEEEGILDEYRQELVRSALDFDVTMAGDIYTPLEAVESINIESSTEGILKKVKETKYSRLPVYKERKENIIGILQTKKFLKSYIRKEFSDIQTLLVKPGFVKMNVQIDDLLRKMSSDKNHICIVKDNNDKTAGIITMEDILEELVGEIWDEDDIVEGEDS